MAEEIERKFLPIDPNWRPTGPFNAIKQGFLWLDDDSQGQIFTTQKGGLVVLTPKGGIQSWEFPIPLKDAEDMRAMASAQFGHHWFARIREIDEKDYLLTFKGPSQDKENLRRPEFEYAISPSDGMALLAFCPETHLFKHRFPIPYEGFTWEIDVFQNVADKVVCEVELTSPEQQPPLPEFVGMEITHDKSYGNAAMAREQMKRWIKPHA